VDLILTRHAKGGVRRDALYASTYTSHFTSICSLALHGTSVFRLNALRVIKWFFPSMNMRSMENGFLKMWMLTHNNHYVAPATCNCWRQNFCVFHRICRSVLHAEKHMFNPLHLSYRLIDKPLRNYIYINALYRLNKRATSFCSLLKKEKFIK